MNQNQTTANKLAAGLASPNYCLLLHKLGCTQRTAFVWLQKGNEYHPFTYEYDPDHYYKDADRQVTDALRMVMIPAYSIEEIKRALENLDYTLSKENNVYKLDVKGYVGNQQLNAMVFNENEADAFAAVLLAILQEKLLPLEYINEKIRHD